MMYELRNMRLMNLEICRTNPIIARVSLGTGIPIDLTLQDQYAITPPSGLSTPESAAVYEERDRYHARLAIVSKE